MRIPHNCQDPPTHQPQYRPMRAVFTSVTRLFRRRSPFLTVALSQHSSPTSSSSPTRTTSRKAKNNNKSRHELVSEAHIAYMQQQQQQQASMFSSSSSLSLPLSPTWTESSSIIGRCNEGEGEGEEASSSSSSPAFESLCHGLRRAEASMSRYLSAPSSSRSGTGTGEPTHSYH